MTKITKNKFLMALKDTAGIQANIARNLGTSRTAVKLYLDKNPEMEKLRVIEEESLVNIAENTMKNLLKQEEQSSILGQSTGKNTRWFLERRVKKYKEKQEVEHTGEPIADNKVVVEVIEVQKNEEL